MPSASSVNGDPFLEEDLVTHFSVLSKFQEDESVSREALCNLVRSRSEKKHVHILLVTRGP